MMNVQVHLSKIASAPEEDRARLREETLREFVMGCVDRHDGVGMTARQLTLLWSDVPVRTPSNRRWTPYGL